MGIKVAFIAAPSCRKSTICSGLESKLKQNKVNVDTSKEYARQYINTYDIPRDLNEQLTISDNQDIRDKAIADVSEVMLTDTSPMGCYIFSVRMLEAIMRERFQQDYTKAQYKFLEEMHIRALKKARSFDVLFVLPLSNLVMDGTRQESSRDQLDIHNALLGFLHTNGIKYIEVPEGTTEEKIDFCYEHITDILNTPCRQ